MNKIFKRKSPLLLIALALSIGGCSTTSQLSSNPKQTSILKTQIAVEYIKNGNIDAAKNALDDAVQKDSSNALAYMMLGVTFQLDGSKESLKKADSFFKKAISIDPENPQIRNNYGQYLFFIEDYKAAINEFSMAAKSVGYSGRDTAYSNLGYSYYNIGDEDNAKAAFINSLKINPRLPDSLLGVASVFYDTGNISDATSVYEDYSRLVSKQNRDAKALWLGIRIAHANEDHVEKASLVALLTNKYPKSNEYKSYLKQRNAKDAVWVP